MTWESYHEVPANTELCAYCGSTFYWWELPDGACSLCHHLVEPSEPDPPRPPPPPLAKVIHINTKRRKGKYGELAEKED